MFLIVIGIIVLVVSILFKTSTSASTTSRQTNLSLKGDKQTIDLVGNSTTMNIFPEKFYTESTFEQVSIKDVSPEKSNVSELHVSKSHVSNICYINMDKNPDRRELMELELAKQRFPASTQIERFVGIPVPGNGAKGCYLSHLHVLAKAVRDTYGHTMILEDDFVFQYSRDVLESHIDKVDQLCKWDVIVLGQYVTDWQALDLTTEPKVFRLFRSTTTSGYIVHKNYLRKLLLKWHLAFDPIQNKSQFDHDDNLDQVQTHFQKVDMWIGFERSLGQPRAGLSTIAGSYVDNTWSCDSTFTKWYHGGKGPAKPLTLRS